MTHIDPVTVAVARGGSDAAVRFAAAQARRTGRPLELVHVAPAAGGWEGQLGRDSMRMAVRRARGVGGRGIDLRLQTLTGDPATELEQVAASAALLVLERRPPVVLRRKYQSLNEALAAAVDVPLVSVPGDWTSGSHGVITAGLDLRHADHRAMHTAIRLARLQGAVLRVLATVSPDQPRPREHAERLLAQLGADACDLALEVTVEDADRALLALARSSDLLVIGRHRPAASSVSRLGAVSRSVLRQAVCPVWLTTPGHDHSTATTSVEQCGPYSGMVGPSRHGRADLARQLRAADPHCDEGLEPVNLG